MHHPTTAYDVYLYSQQEPEEDEQEEKELSDDLYDVMGGHGLCQEAIDAMRN